MDDLERGYTTAATEYTKQLKKDLKRHQGDYNYIERRTQEYFSVMNSFATKMLDMGLDVKVVNDPRKQAINIYNNILYESQTGGESR